MEIIVPAAGLSTRFPGLRPKFTLTDFEGKLMLYKAIAPYIGKFNITVGILKEHNDKHDIIDLIHSEINPNIRVVVLEYPTKGPADTVKQIIELAGIDLNQSILIKDCDSFFDHDAVDGNYVAVTKIKKNSTLKQLAAKSFVVSNDQNIITHIVEKDIVSDTFCIGGYKFESAKLYLDHFNKLNKSVSELFVSHIVQSCIMSGEIFLENLAENYIDVGTVEEWWDYNQSKPTIFCDFDGTIIQAQPRNQYHTEPVIMVKSVARLLELQSQGAEFVFTTARPNSAEAHTKNILDQLGFKNYRLLMSLHSSKRILINDYNNANPYPTAQAINVKRDSDTLKDFL